ncbi:MAG: GNAT family N-acetyltransferase [Bacteroidia bacterium]
MMPDPANIHCTKVKDAQSMERVWAIRKEVFVNEQKVDESLEFDHEEESTHFLCFIDGEPVGTARWRDSGKGLKLERFAVKKEFRNLGVGAALVQAVLDDLPPGQRVYLHSQSAAVPFYSRHGFHPVGPEFYEAGIAHFVMEWGLPKK